MLYVADLGEVFKELAPRRRIRQLRRMLLVHSYLYYSKESIVSDSQWDKWAKELVILQNDYPKMAEHLEFSEEFKDFDGSTGYNLPWNDNDIVRRAEHVTKYHKDKHRTVDDVGKSTKACKRYKQSCTDRGSSVKRNSRVRKVRKGSGR